MSVLEPAILCEAWHLSFYLLFWNFIWIQKGSIGTLRYDSGLYVLCKAFFSSFLNLMAIFTQHLENDISEKISALNMQQTWRNRTYYQPKYLILQNYFQAFSVANYYGYFNTLTYLIILQ